MNHHPHILSIRAHSFSHQQAGTSPIPIMRYNIRISSYLQIISNIYIYICTDRISLIIKPFDNTFLTHIVSRDIILHIFSSTTYANVMILNNTCLRYGINPICLISILIVLHFILIFTKPLNRVSPGFCAT